MHTVDLLEHALDLAARLGYTIRQEWLADTSGGGCELKGRKLFFLNLDLGPDEQLQRLLDTLRRDPEAVTLPMSHPLREQLARRKSA